MPHLQSLWSEAQQKWGDKVAFLAVNLMDGKDVIQKWWDKEKFTLRAVRQEGDQVSRAFGVRVYPTNYVLGPDGKVLYREIGYDEGAIRAALARALAP